MFKGQPSKGQIAEKKHQRQGNKRMKSCIVSIVRFRPFLVDGWFTWFTWVGWLRCKRSRVDFAVLWIVTMSIVQGNRQREEQLKNRQHLPLNAFGWALGQTNHWMLLINCMSHRYWIFWHVLINFDNRPCTVLHGATTCYYHVWSISGNMLIQNRSKQPLSHCFLRLFYESNVLWKHQRGRWRLMQWDAQFCAVVVFALQAVTTFVS